MSMIDRCPICGAMSMDGKPCEPYCEAGNCHAAHITLLPPDESYGRRNHDTVEPDLHRARKRLTPTSKEVF